MACAIGMDLGTRIKPGQLLPTINSPKCRGIVRYQNSAQRCGNSENLRIRHAFRNDILWQFEVNFGFAAKNTGNDILIKIGVSREPNPQPYLGKTSSRARFSFLDKLSGSGGCPAANSCDNRSCAER